MNNWSIRDEFLYGGDYNPDQWLDRPDILEDDLRLMDKARVNVVSLGIFSWSTLEPEEGVFRFEWMDRLLDNLAEKGIRVFLATPSGARPDWMVSRYPEVLRVGPDGNRNLFGGRHNHCFSSPIYRDKVRIINSLLAERYTDHPAVVLWHISNEYSGSCHCSLCQENFRLWLKERYGSLDELNRAWWNTFWSHTVTDWGNLHSPVSRGEETVHGLNLDWKRFVTHMTVDFMDHEIRALKDAGSALPVTTNMMMSMENPEEDPGLDYWRFRDHQDLFSWDSYPTWHLPGYLAGCRTVRDEPADDYRRASEVSFQHDLFRSMGKGPFLLMESTPSNVNWQPVSKLKKPGMNILSSLQAVAHGANSVQYFQWRKSRGSSEKFHGALVDHSGSEDSRVFREAADLGRLLEEIKPLADTDYPAEAAVLYNWENRWAFEDSRGPLNDSRKGYLETLKKHYYCLWDLGVPMDIVSGEEDLSGYKFLVVPMLYMVTEKCSENLVSFVRNGGTLVTTYLTGYVDGCDLCFEGGAPGPLKELLGIRVEDLDALHPFESIGITGENCGGSSKSGEEFLIRDYYELVHTDSAEVQARFCGGIGDGEPSLTVNSFGQGMAWHLAGRMDSTDLLKLYRFLVSETDLRTGYDAVEYREGSINIQRRVSSKEDILFVMNFSGKSASVEFNREYRDYRNPGDIRQKWSLPPYGILLLKQ